MQAIPDTEQRKNLFVIGHGTVNKNWWGRIYQDLTAFRVVSAAFSRTPPFIKDAANPNFTFVPLGHKLLFSPGELRRIYRCIQEADLVHVYGVAVPITLPAAIMARILGKRLIVTVRDSLIYINQIRRYGWKALVPFLFPYLTLKLAHAITVYTEREREWLQSIGIKASVILQERQAPCVDTDRLDAILARETGGDGSSPTTMKAVYAGRIASQKNLVRLVEAVAELRNHHHQPFHLSLVGPVTDPRYYRKLIAAIERLQLQSCVTVDPRFMDHEELVRLYLDADLFVMPSARESFGNTIIEAAYCGIPIVATVQSGATEFVVEHGLGRACDAFDLTGMVSTLKDAVDDLSSGKPRHNPQYREEIKATFSFEIMRTRLECIYREVLAAG